MSRVSIGMEVKVNVKVKVVMGLQIKSIPHAASIHCRCGSFLEEERRGEERRGEERRGEERKKGKWEKGEGLSY
jgi:orotate phosphoribosyltransferase